MLLVESVPMNIQNNLPQLYSSEEAMLLIDELCMESAADAEQRAMIAAIVMQAAVEQPQSQLVSSPRPAPLGQFVKNPGAYL